VSRYRAARIVACVVTVALCALVLVTPDDALFWPFVAAFTWLSGIALGHWTTVSR
jgi:hypothetical protein